MDNNIHLTINTDALEEAGAQAKRIAEEEIAPAAALIETAFVEAAGVIRSELSSAARSGELSLKSLGRALAQSLRGFAIENLVRQPIHNLITGVLGGASGGALGGARMGGGPVAPGASFLVGERGPELFTPGAAGAITPLSRGGLSGGVSVNITLPGVRDADSLRRSEGQIAAAMARAVARGHRNL